MARIPYNPVRESPAFRRQQQFRVPVIDERRLSFSYPSFGADPELAPPVSTPPPPTTTPEPEPPPSPAQTRGVFQQRRQERERGGDQAGPPDTHGAAAGETDDWGEFGKSVAFGLGMTSGIGALGTMAALGAGLAADVDPRDIGLVSAIDSLHAEPEPDVAEPEPEPEPEPAAPAPGAPAAGAGAGRGGADLDAGGIGGYGGRGFADTPAAMGDPGAQSAPGGVGRTGDPIGGGRAGGGTASAGARGGVGGYGSSGRGASDPGVMGVGGGVTGRGIGHGDNAGSRGFGRGGSTGSQFGGGGRETGIGGGGHGEGAGSGSCFISSATVDAFGWPDRCRPLELLRWWRDHVLRPVPGGERAISFYYDCAPSIVAAINARPNRDEVYAMVWRRFLRPFIAAIAAGKNRRAFTIYMTMILALRRAFK